jgi:hypothetical protein
MRRDIAAISQRRVQYRPPSPLAALLMIRGNRVNSAHIEMTMNLTRYACTLPVIDNPSVGESVHSDPPRDLRQTHPDATPHAQARLWHVSCSRAGLPTAGHPRGIPQETCQSLPDPTTLAFMTTVWRRSRPPATCLDVCNDTTPGGFGQPSRGRPSQAPLGCATIPN